MPKLPSAIKDHDLNMFEVQQKIFLRHIVGKMNKWADLLSREKLKEFWKIAQQDIKQEPKQLLDRLWPASKLWINY